MIPMMRSLRTVIVIYETIYPTAPHTSIII